MFCKRFFMFSTILAACSGTFLEDSDILPGNLDEGVQAICNSVAGCPCEGECCGPGSPIILDLSGNGFALTDAPHGVSFDLRANGRPELWAWTMASSDDAWLALDRDADGAITSGAELFGNHTDQPQSPHPNGYLALAVFDTNGDGQIDSADPIYSSLRLWIDANHDGVSQPQELHTLAEFGILSLSTDYRTQARVDGNGNVFRYRSSLTRAPGSPVNHITYDVILVNADRVSALQQGERAQLRPVNGITSTGGTFDTKEGQKVLRALLATESTLAEDRRILPPLEGVDAPSSAFLSSNSQSLESAQVSAVPADAYPPCSGAYLVDPGGIPVGVASLQESLANGVGWQVLLASSQAPMGLITFSAQIYGGGYLANVYAPHTEQWNYAFHGIVPRSFQVFGLTCPHELQRGDVVDFTWYWVSLSLPPPSGGFMHVACIFSP